MIIQIMLGGIPADVELKDIKHIHLSVYPPNGRVRITAPKRLDLETIRVYALTKLGWIKKQQDKFRLQDRETQREYLERESHYLWGDHYLLHIVEVEKPPVIEVGHHEITLSVRPGSSEAKKQAIMDEWYRRQLREVAQPYIDTWEKRMGVEVQHVYVQRMKTRWGTCNTRKGSIRLNTELAKKPRTCLEYVVVHELAHLIEPSHNAHFKALLDQYLPNWRQLKDELNQAPLGHVEWEY